jgi:hypothetical protein
MFNLIPLEMLLNDMYGITVDKALNGKEAVTLFDRNYNKTCCDVRY